MKKFFSVVSFITVFYCAAFYCQDTFAAEHKIEIKNHQFTQKNITINVGETITWINRDEDPHTVFNTDQERLFHSSALDTNDHYSYTFSKKGDYHYFCSMHPDMTGTIVVQ